MKNVELIDNNMQHFSLNTDAIDFMNVKVQHPFSLFLDACAK